MLPLAFWLAAFAFFRTFLPIHGAAAVGTFGTATSAAGRLESYLAESGSLIAECREIIESIGKDTGEESTERIRGTDR